MILTDREIESAIQCGQIRIEPLPDVSSYSSTTVDLTLGRDGTEWKVASGMMIRPSAKGYKYSEMMQHQKKVEFDGYELKPQTFVLGWTKERIELPPSSRIAARVEGKSGLARLGVGVHVTAPTIHAGFKGAIQLEMFNFSPNSIILDEGIKICQLIFEQTFGTPQAGYKGMFLGQGPTG